VKTLEPKAFSVVIALSFVPALSLRIGLGGQSGTEGFNDFLGNLQGSVSPSPS